VTFLLDTHVLPWALSTPNRLPDGMRTAILDPTSTVMASAVNIAEIAIRSSIGKLDIGSGLEADNYGGLIAAIVDETFARYSVKLVA
jgi:PIN domain nuclease of toxin-antitoxin system